MITFQCMCFVFPQLGVVGRGNYGEGSGAIHIRQVTCSGSERTLLAVTTSITLS